MKSVFGTTVLPNTKLFFFLPQFQPQFFNQTQETVFFKTTTSTTVLTKHQFFLKQPHKKYFLLNYFFQTATTKATTIPNTLLTCLRGTSCSWIGLSKLSLSYWKRVDDKNLRKNVRAKELMQLYIYEFHLIMRCCTNMLKHTSCICLATCFLWILVKLVCHCFIYH